MITVATNDGADDDEEFSKSRRCFVVIGDDV